MPIEVKRLPNEPVILLTYTGVFEAGALTNAFHRSVELLAEIGESAYRISDVRSLEVDPLGMGELLKLIRAMREDKAGSSADPRFHAVLVGGHSLARMYADFMRQNEFGNTILPFFHTLDEALVYIRFEIEQAKKDKGE